MSLSRKLSRLTGVGFGGQPPETTTPHAHEPEPRADEREVPGHEAGADDESRWDAFRAALRSKTSREAKRPDGPRIEIPGVVETTPHGPLHRILRAFDEDHRHGETPVASVHALEPTWLARFALDDAFAGVDLSRLLFLDTETTGLAGGTGTVPFLVGVAWFEGKRLHVEQLFLRRLGEEAPILARLAEHVERASCIVTYNGKSFDWPLLRTRYVMNRLALPKAAAHLDLVHATRRLLRGRMPSVRLVEVERAVLGHVREGDVDGARIPAIYLEYHRDGHHPEMPLVIAHNELDLVAMPAILGKLAARFGGSDDTADALDWLACAFVSERAGDHGLADHFSSRAMPGLGPEDATRAHLLRARLARRRAAPADEEAALHAALGAAADELVASTVHLALAKLYEHRLRDAARALEHAARTALAEGDDASLRRRTRLARRVVPAADETPSLFAEDDVGRPDAGRLPPK